MTKAPTPTEKSKKRRDNTKTATKNFDYTTIADRLRTVSWGNDSHPTGVVKTGLRDPDIPTNRKSRAIKRIFIKIIILDCGSSYYELEPSLFTIDF